MRHESLDEVLDAMVIEARANGKPLTHVAEEIGMNYKKLERELNPFDDGAKLGAKALIPLMTSCGSVLPLEYIAHRMGYRIVPIQGCAPDKPTFAEECMDTYPAVTAFHAAMTERKSVAEISRHLNNAVRELEEDMSSYMQQLAGAKVQS